MESMSEVLRKSPPEQPPTRLRALRVETRKPAWWTSSASAKLAADNRARCPQCRGHHSDAGRLLDKELDRRTNAVLYLGCRECWLDGGTKGPCQRHRCPVCDGSGVVCPECRGFRFLHADVDAGHPQFGQLFRCAHCCRGNHVDPVAEAAAIAHYAAAYRRAHDPAPPPRDAPAAESGDAP